MCRLCRLEACQRRSGRRCAGSREKTASRQPRAIDRCGHGTTPDPRSLTNCTHFVRVLVSEPTARANVSGSRVQTPSPADVLRRCERLSDHDLDSWRSMSSHSGWLLSLSTGSDFWLPIRPIGANSPPLGAPGCRDDCRRAGRPRDNHGCWPDAGQTRSPLVIAARGELFEHDGGSEGMEAGGRIAHGPGSIDRHSCCPSMTSRRQISKVVSIQRRRPSRPVR